ncbi:DUF397 domain-containing protein [Kitasatospora acidiphila]|nr:DUF397 domain-containing protein [Kitasatospora acidiphila]
MGPGVRRTRVVRVRDSKSPDGPALAFTPEEFAAFVQAVKHRTLR